MSTPAVLLGLELARRVEAGPSTAAGRESDDPVDEPNAAVRLYNTGQLTGKTVSAALTSVRRAGLEG